MENEAPVVMFTNYKREDGFEVSLTLRGTNMAEVATHLNSAIEMIKENGGTPVTRNFQKAFQPSQNASGDTKMCSEHNIAMKEKLSVKTGKNYFSHSEKTDGEWKTCFGGGWK